MSFLGRLINHAIVYYQNFIKPYKVYRSATIVERAALEELYKELSHLRILLSGVLKIFKLVCLR